MATAKRSPRTRAGPPWEVPQPCRHGCGIQVIVARRGDNHRVWIALEAAEQTPFTVPGCWVLVSGQAWTPRDLVEHFRVRFETTESHARELAAGYAWHRAHHHDTHDSPTSTDTVTT
jgi:hypothetical protein